MLKGVYRLKIQEENKPTRIKVQENLVLNNGLKSILTLPVWHGFILPLVEIGSDPIDVSPEQTGVQQFLGLKQVSDPGSGLSRTISVGPDVDEYVKITYSFEAKEWEYNGIWAELSVPNLNRVVLSEPGELEAGIHRYAMTSKNSVGESIMSNILEIGVIDPGSSIRLAFEPAPNQTSNTRTPSGYILYKEIDGEFKRVATTSASETNRYYHYDRGDYTALSGTFNPSNTIMAPPDNLNGVVTLKPTPKPITKTQLMKIGVEIEIFVGNNDLLII